MATWSLIVALLLVVASLALAEDRPYLLVRKSLVNGEFIANKNTFVQIDIFNVGASTAYDVNLDDEWDEKFRVAGLSDAHWDRIAPGANVSHIYVVTAPRDGYYKTQTAKVTYRSSPNGAPYTGISTSIGETVEVVARAQSSKNAASHLQEWGIFAALVLASSALPYAMWSYVQKNFENGIRKSDKKQQ